MPGEEGLEKKKVIGTEAGKTLENVPETLSVEEIMRTPTMRFAVAGTADGLETASSIEVAKKDDGSLQYIHGPIYDNREELEVIELRGIDEHAQRIQKVLDEDGVIVVERLAKGYKYRGLYVRCRDTSGRAGHKGVVIGWPQADQGLDKKMVATLEPTDNGVQTFLEIWRRIYANDSLWKEKFTDPGRTEWGRDNTGNYTEVTRQLKTYFDPPESV